MSLIKWHNPWPGGFPSSIRRHEKPVEDVEFATRAWRCFAREQWVDADGTVADQQRRALIERWATAEQEFRDDACLVEQYMHDLDDVYVCLTEWTPEKQALLAKIIMALFSSFDGSFEHMVDYISILLPFEDNQGDIVDKFKFLRGVNRPDFLDMHMALDGTVLFADRAPKLIIDDRTLETGLALWVQFESNGTKERVYRVQMLMQEFVYIFLDVHYNLDSLDNALIYLEDDLDTEPGLEDILEDEPVAMRRPFVEIYRQRNISDMVDRYAPGLREAENAGNGLAIGYDLERILSNNGQPLTILENCLPPQRLKNY
ncbi:unnamed protein product [Penicillium pancosmium]